MQRGRPTGGLLFSVRILLSEFRTQRRSMEYCDELGMIDLSKYVKNKNRYLKMEKYVDSDTKENSRSHHQYF